MSIPEVQPSIAPAVAHHEAFMALCDWIQANAAHQPIGWSHLMERSGWTHQELISFFMFFLQTTPMAYIKAVRGELSRAYAPTPSVLRRPLVR